MLFPYHLLLAGMRTLKAPVLAHFGEKTCRFSGSWGLWLERRWGEVFRVSQCPCNPPHRDSQNPWGL